MTFNNTSGEKARLDTIRSCIIDVKYLVAYHTLGGSKMIEWGEDMWRD